MNKLSLSATFLIIFGLIPACKFSFIPKGGIENEKTINIYQFSNNSGQGPADMAITFTEKTKDYFMQNTKLELVDEDADIELKSMITSYRIASVAAQANETAALNRLTITVNVDYTNNLRPEKSFKKNFSFFDDFSVDQNVNEVEEELIDNISDQIIRDIFNSSVGEW